MAPASLFSVELEFLAMADQANRIFVGVASIKLCTFFFFFFFFFFSL